MKKVLELAPELKLPAAEAVTQKYAAIGRSGSGKSYGAMRLGELFLADGAQIVALDWVGIWWSLRLSADGKTDGFKHVYIFGGEHADVPLEPTSGAVMADLVVDKHISVVLDLMHFRKAERTRFATAFAEQFFHRKKTARTACHLFVEEAQAYLPQMVRGDDARMVGVFEDIGKVGRNYGIGVTLISQRPQAINKDVLNQTEVLLAFQTNGPQERKAIAGWAAENAGAGAEMIAELPKLHTGQAITWSPQWLRLTKKVHISARVTYDASSTPTQRARRLQPKALTSTDLEQLGESIKSTVEKAEAADPVKLRAKLETQRKATEKQTTDLQRQLTAALADLERAKAALSTKTDKADRTAAKAAHAELKAELVKYRRALESAMKILVKVKAIDFTVDTEEGRKALEQAVAAAIKQVTAPIEKRVTALVGRVEGFKLAAKHAEDEIAALLAEKIDLTVQVQSRAPFTVQDVQPRAVRAPAPKRAPIERPDGFVITGPMQRILNALAWCESMRLPNPRKEKLAFLADASPTSSAFTNNLGALRTAGLIDYPMPGVAALTDGGRGDAQIDDTIPTTSDALQAAICAKLPTPQARIVTELVKAYPEALEKTALAERADASATSSSYTNNLGSLRSLGLIDYPTRGYVVAAPVLFLESAA